MALPSKPERRRSRLAVAIAASLAVHVPLLVWTAANLMLKPRPMQVSLVPSKARGAQAQRGAPTSGPSTGQSRPDAAPSPAPQPKKDEQVLLEEQKALLEKGQVVALGAPRDERPPERPTKYLSERDSRTLIEMRSRDTSAFYKNPASSRQLVGRQDSKSPSKPAPPPPSAGGLTQGQARGAQASRIPETAAPGSDGPVVPEVKSRQRRDALHVKVAPGGTLANREARDAVAARKGRMARIDPQTQGDPKTDLSHPLQSQEGGAQGKDATGGSRRPGVPSLLDLKLENPESALGPVAGGPAPDDLRGVDEGPQTLLNARSFKFASYLNRLTESLGREWSPRVLEESERRDPTGAQFGYKDRTTVLNYVLDKDGALREVKVVSSSGVEYLDRVAVEAFERVGHFPNPPAALVGPDGTIRMGFAFTLSVSGGGPMRIQLGRMYPPGYNGGP